MILDDTQALEIVQALTRSQTLERAWSHLSAQPEWLPHLPSTDRPYDDWTVILRRARSQHLTELARSRASSLVWLVSQCLPPTADRVRFLAWIDEATEQADDPSAGAPQMPSNAWLKLDRAPQKGELDELLGPASCPLLLLGGARSEVHWNLCRRAEMEAWPTGVRARAVRWVGTPCSRGEISETVARGLPGGDSGAELGPAAVRAAVSSGPLVLCMEEVREPLEECLRALQDFYLYELPALRACAGTSDTPAPLQVLQPIFTDGPGQDLLARLQTDPDPSPAMAQRLRRMAPAEPDPVAWVRGLRARWPVMELSALTPIGRMHVQMWATQFIPDPAERASFVAQVITGASSSQEIFSRVRAYNEERSS